MRSIPVQKMTMTFAKYRTRGSRLSHSASIAAALGAALILAGCSSSSSSAPSKADYDRQANAICATYNGKLKSLGSTISNSASEQQVASQLGKAVSLAEQGSAKLEALTKPDGQSAALNKVYAAQEAQVKQIRALQTALSQNDPAKAQSIENALDAGDGSLNRQFDALGLTTCGSNS
jgi:PBP1b-binding outer membrane lipoprotein LpoB